MYMKTVVVLPVIAVCVGGCAGAVRVVSFAPAKEVEVPTEVSRPARAAVTVVENGTPNTLVGKIITAEQGAPLGDARVILVETRQATNSLADGSFRLEHVPPGDYTLRVLRVGYEEARGQVGIAAAGSVVFVSMNQAVTRWPGDWAFTDLRRPPLGIRLLTPVAADGSPLIARNITIRVRHDDVIQRLAVDSIYGPYDHTLDVNPNAFLDTTGSFDVEVSAPGFDTWTMRHIVIVRDRGGHADTQVVPVRLRPRR
jgi:Carboxypeptidase regulatory-like domain